MGVVCVLNYPVPEGQSGQQTVDNVQKRLETLGAEKAGNFCVDCEIYQSQSPAPQRSLNVLHNSEQPATCFAVLDTGTCLVSDIFYDALMQKMKGFYAARKNLRVESRGQRYQLGDFLVKVGSVVLSQMTNFKGVLIEVEYLPCAVPAECWTLMKEFLVSFLGASVSVSLDVPSQHFRTNLDNIQSPSDAILQYLEHFNNFRKVASVAPR